MLVQNIVYFMTLLTGNGLLLYPLSAEMAKYYFEMVSNKFFFIVIQQAITL